MDEEEVKQGTTQQLSEGPRGDGLPMSGRQSCHQLAAHLGMAWLSVPLRHFPQCLGNGSGTKLQSQERIRNREGKEWQIQIRQRKSKR